MSDTPTFTAETCRIFSQGRRIMGDQSAAELSDAFAQRLEQEADVKMRADAFVQMAGKFATDEQLREEGRQAERARVQAVLDAPENAEVVKTFNGMRQTLIERLNYSSESLPEKWREEGRREVLRELAAATFEPEAFYKPASRHQCQFCGAANMTQDEPHLVTCLWLRAQEAAK